MCQAFEASFRLAAFFERVTCSCKHSHHDHGKKRTAQTASQPSFIGAICASWIPYSDFKVCPCKKCDCKEHCQSTT
jgi:hypothetical protein